MPRKSRPVAERIATNITITQTGCHQWNPKSVVIYFHGGQVHPVRALLNLSSKQRIHNECGNERCVNPDHYTTTDGNDVKERIAERIAVVTDDQGREHHMWTGTTSGSKTKPYWYQSERGGKPVSVAISPKISYQGKIIHPVRALLNAKPTERLVRRMFCGRPLCVNPECFTTLIRPGPKRRSMRWRKSEN